jgi:hypothetical protein
MASKAASADEAAAVMMTSRKPELEAAAVVEEEAAAVSPLPPAAISLKSYYECVFRKRGFTTVRALSGHMNIHHWDRAEPTARDSPAGITSSATTSTATWRRHRILFHSQRRRLRFWWVPAQDSAWRTTSGVAAATATAAARLDAEDGSPSSMSPRVLTLFGEAANVRNRMPVSLRGGGGELGN